MALENSQKHSDLYEWEFVNDILAHKLAAAAEHGKPLRLTWHSLNQSFEVVKPCVSHLQ